MAAEIEKLIERLEKLAGPDREADVLESVCAQASEAIRALATTLPAEGETK